MYYIEENNKIVLYNVDRRALEDSLQFYPQYQNLEILYTEEEIVTYNGAYYFKNDIEEQLIRARQEKFNKEFFQTSLGYIRRKFTNKNGEIKDFLSDAFPSLLLAFKEGIVGEIFVYDKPSFDTDVIDWTLYQHKVPITLQFIQECFNQSNIDFFG